MSAEGGRAKQPKKRQVARLGVLPRPVALVVLGLWVVLTAVALVGLVRAPTIWSGSREGLTPVADRAARGQPLALLRVDPEVLAEPTEPDPSTPSAERPSGQPEIDPATVLADAGVAIEEALGRERVPLAPPKTEITRWLDAHALYLLPVDTHEGLAERLSDARMLAEVQGLEARLASPLFVVSGEQPRRDPLGVHELTDAQLGRLGHVAELPGSDDPRVSASGDLIAASGDRALIALRSDRPAAELLADLRAAVAELPVSVVLVDPRVEEAQLAAQLGAGADAGLVEADDGLRAAAKLTLAGFAALVLLLSIVMRRLVPVLAVAACLASVWVVLMFGLVSVELAGAGGVELGAVAMAMIALGFGCDAALRLPQIGVKGWASSLVTATALLPLLLTPYPLWQRWAVIWLVALLLTAVIMRLVLPTLLALLRGDVDWRRPGFRLTPMPGLAILLCLGLTAAGAWSSQELRYRPGTRLPTAVAEITALEHELVEHFFDPTMIVTAESSSSAAAGEHPTAAAAALEAAAADVAALAELVPSEARRVDSPGSFVLPKAELESRRTALRGLKLGERMDALEQLLVDQGLRAEAFAEFVRGAADIDDLPSAQAALDGPLGPWIASYVLADAEAGTAILRSRVELRGREGLPSVPITDERLAALPSLRGPAIAAMIDQREFDDRAGIVVLSGLWLAAFLVWLGTGSLASSIAVALVAVASECGVLLALALLDQPVGPHLLPVLILVGASAAVAGGRACRAVSLAQPIVARGVLLAGACQVTIGLILLGSGQPLWRELGLALAIGSALASGLGLFATPGLARLFDKLRQRPRPKPDKPKPGKPSKPDGESKGGGE